MFFDALSLQATIFGAAISNNYYNLQKRHPQADRPLVDYYTAMLLEPVLLAGTVMGVLVNAVSPGWLITVLLVLVLSFTTWRTFQKGMKTYRQECGQGASVDAYAPLVPSPQDGEAIRGVQSYASMGGDAGELGTQDVDAILEEERHVPRHALLVLAISWVYIFFVAVMKGGEGAQGIVPCGTFGYWAILFSIVPVFGALQMWSSKVLIARHRRKEAAGYRYLDGDIQWTYTRTLLYPLTCIVAGFCAGEFIPAFLASAVLFLCVDRERLCVCRRSGYCSWDGDWSNHARNGAVCSSRVGNIWVHGLIHRIINHSAISYHGSTYS